MNRVFTTGLMYLFMLTAGQPVVLAQAFISQSLLFPEETNRQLYGLPRWADCDNDGDLDVLFDNGTYLNEGVFFTRIQEDIDNTSFAHRSDWFDFNQDARLDILGTYAFRDLFLGKYQLVNNIFPFDGCRFYSRYGDIVKAKIDPANDPVITAFLYTSTPPTTLYGDDNQDGHPDLLVCAGDTNKNLVTRILHFNKNAYKVIDTVLLKESPFVVAWEDFDNDSDLDILSYKFNNGGVSLWAKELNGYIKATIPDEAGDLSAYSPAIWLDVDNDGQLDIVRLRWQRGGDQTVYSLQAWKYEQGTFKLAYQDSLAIPMTSYEENVYNAGFQMGDVNNDGTVDVVMDVQTSDRHFINFFYNQGNFVFHTEPDLQQSSSFDGSNFALVDYDRDGDLDISSGKQLLKNPSSKPNVSPGVPTGLQSNVQGSAITFHWNAVTDDHTPSQGLTYNIHIVNESKQIHYLNGMSNLTTGIRNVFKRGNAGASTQKQLVNLPDGTYYWTVQAIDINLASSRFAPWQSFTIKKGAVSAAIQLVQPQKLNSCECGYQETAIKLTGTFNEGNRFLLQLSDSTGKFQDPVTLFNVADYTSEDFFQNNPQYNPELHFRQNDSLVLGHLPTLLGEGTHYRVRVVSTDPVRISTDNGYDVAIKKLPQLPEIAEVDNELCANPVNTRLRLQIPSQYANQYDWVLDPVTAGTVSALGEEAEINWNDTYTGNVRIRVRGVNGCGYSSYSIPIELFIPPAIGPIGAIQGPNLVCPGQKEVAFAINPIANVDVYHWTLPLGATLTEGFANNTYHIKLDFGDNYVGGQLQVTAVTACPNKIASSLLVQSIGQVAQASSIIGPDSVCLGQEWVTFSVLPLANATHYLWTLPEGLRPSGEYVTESNSINVSFTNKAFQGSITVRGVNDCQPGAVSPPLILTVTSLPQMLGMIQGEELVCPDKTIAAYAIVPIASASGYRWILPKGLEPVNSTITRDSHITLQVNNNFSGGNIQVSAFNFCGESTLSPPFSIRPLPRILPVSITQSCNTLKIPSPNYPMQWYFEGVSLPGAKQSDLFVEQEGKYTVKIFGPCDTLASEIQAEPITPTLDDIPNVFTPNGDRTNQTFQLAKKLIGSKISIYNRWGIEVYRSESYQNEWDGDGLSNGSYFYLITIECLSHPLRGIVELLR